MITVNKIIGHTSITFSLTLPYSKKCRDILALRLEAQIYLLQVDCLFFSLHIDVVSNAIQCFCLAGLRTQFNSLSAGSAFA
jgi:hypothetical protein